MYVPGFKITESPDTAPFNEAEMLAHGLCILLIWAVESFPVSATHIVLSIVTGTSVSPNPSPSKLPLNEPLNTPSPVSANEALVTFSAHDEVPCKEPEKKASAWR